MKEQKHMQKVLNTGMFTQRQQEPFCAPNNIGLEHFAHGNGYSQQHPPAELFHFQHKQIQSL